MIGTMGSDAAEQTLIRALNRLPQEVTLAANSPEYLPPGAVRNPAELLRSAEELQARLAAEHLVVPLAMWD